MAHYVEFNFTKRFFSKLNEFRACEKYTDVTIECGSTSFKCHRLALAVASDYFEAMFCNEFKENVDKKVVLHDVDASTFGLVVQFLYSGKLEIDSDNVYNLLRVSDFLGIDEIEELCIGFVSENLKNVNTLDIFIFACMARKSVLIDMLGRCDMTRQLEQFFQDDAHLEISFDTFSTILKKWKTTSQDAIVRWINCSIEKRRQYFDDLVRIHAESVVLNLDTSLYVCLKYLSSDLGRTFVINLSQSKNCSVLHNIDHSRLGMLSEPVMLDHSRIFYLRNRPYPEFIVSESIDLCPSTTYLSPPPVVGSNFALCNMLNRGIYLYDTNLFCNPNIHANYDWPDEIQRGIYFYNCEVDNWFHVPAMKTRSKHACMTVLDNMLYLIGGDKTAGYVQAYDHRAGVWLEMPETRFRYLESVCCTLDDRIYVCGGGRFKRKVERLNLVAGKWEKIKSTHWEIDQRAQVVPYANQLWILNRAEFEDKYLHIDVFDPQSKMWCISPILKEASRRSRPQEHFVGIDMGFVFKSF